MDSILSGILESVLEQARSGEASQDCIATYGAFLKERYQELSVFPDCEWPPFIGDQYIRLALIKHPIRLPTQESIREMREDLLRGRVDKVAEEKEAIDIPGIFACPEKGKHLRVLVDGAPGVGKTTLCRKISQDWGCDGFLSGYQLVVLLHLRDRQIAKAMRIEEFFHHDDPELQAKVVRQVRNTSGAGVLLIFDGFDELSEEERMDRSLFLDIIKGEVLSQCSVLVTSRPYASENLQCLRSVVRHVEVLGFKEEQMYECVTKTIKDESKAEDLVTLLKQRVDIISLCYIPLNCAILLYVYQQQDYALPSTLTELFEIFILNTLKRDVKLQRAHKSAKKIRDLISLPPPISGDLDHLCKLAFDGLVKDKMVFQYEEIEESKLLGLMTAFKSFSSVGDDITYQFLHLTIQEFLAARWVATHMSPQEQATFFKEHFSDDHFRMMLLFLSGITKLDDSVFSTVFSAELDFVIPQEEQRHIMETEKLFFRLVHLLYESQNTTHCHTLACAINEQTIVLTNNVSPFLFLAFASFLGRSNYTWKRLDFGTNTLFCDEQLDILCQQLEKELPSLSSVTCSVQQLHVTHAQYFMHIFCMEDLFRIIGIPAFKHLEKLLIFEGIENEWVTLSSPSSSDLKSLQCLMRNGTLEELTLRFVAGMEDKVVECIGQELATSITLKVLDIGSDNISNSGLCSLFHALKCNKSLETLYVQKYMCGDLRELGLAVESALRANKTLQVLSIHDHHTYTCLYATTLPAVQYPEKFYSGLFRGITRTNSSLKSLTIAEDSFVASEEVVSSLTKMLHNNKSLTSLSIIGKVLPSIFFDALADGLAQNSSLTRLCVKSRHTTREPSLEQLASALSQNSSLKTLVFNLRFAVTGEYVAETLLEQFTVCSVRPETFIFLLRILSVNTSLTSITFMYPFTDAQLKIIARCLVLNGHRCEIDLKLDNEFMQSSGKSMQECYESFVQKEVDEFKSELVTMLHSVYHAYQKYKREKICFHGVFCVSCL